MSERELTQFQHVNVFEVNANITQTSYFEQHTCCVAAEMKRCTHAEKKKVCSCHQRREQPVAIMSLPLFVLATTRNISLIVCIGTAVSSF